MDTEKKEILRYLVGKSKIIKVYKNLVVSNLVKEYLF